MTLSVSVQLFADPWSHLFPLEELGSAIKSIAEATAAEIEARHATGEFNKTSFGIVLLDPTAPLWKPSQDCVLAIIAIGEEGAKYTLNGLAKALEHRDHGFDCGIGVYVRPESLTDGDFKWGYSYQDGSMIAGGSGLSEIQDRLIVGKFVVELNYRIASAKKAWVAANTDNGWYCNQNIPSVRYTDTLERLAKTGSLIKL